MSIQPRVCVADCSVCPVIWQISGSVQPALASQVTAVSRRSWSCAFLSDGIGFTFPYRLCRKRLPLCRELGIPSRGRLLVGDAVDGGGANVCEGVAVVRALPPCWLGLEDGRLDGLLLHRDQSFAIGSLI